MVTSWYGDSIPDGLVAGSFTRIEYEPFNLNSDVQVKQFLLDQGWKPLHWNHRSDGTRSSPSLSSLRMVQMDSPMDLELS